MSESWPRQADSDAHGDVRGPASSETAAASVERETAPARSSTPPPSLTNVGVGSGRAVSSLRAAASLEFFAAMGGA